MTVMAVRYAPTSAALGKQSTGLGTEDKEHGNQNRSGAIVVDDSRDS
jgi:hypothetical protein